MNQKIQYFIISMLLSLMVFIITVAIWSFLILPLIQDQLDQVAEDCITPDCTFTIDQSPVQMIFLVVPALIVFYFTLNLLAKRNEKKWASLR